MTLVTSRLRAFDVQEQPLFCCYFDGLMRNHRKDLAILPRQPMALSRRRFLVLTSLAGISGCASASSHLGQDVGYSILAEQYASGLVLYSEYPDQPLPAASLVKLLIAIALIDADLLKGGLNVRIPKRAYEARNLFFPGSVAGDSVPAEALLGHMIERSDNFSSNVLISYLGVAEIDATAKRIGLSRTAVRGFFVDTNAPLLPRDFTTARECNKMLRYILRVARTVGAQHHKEYVYLISMMLRQSDRRFIPSAVPAGVRVADKTGEIHGEINDASIIGPFGLKPVLITVLAHGEFDVFNLPQYSQAITTIQSHFRHVVDGVLLKSQQSHAPL